MNGLFLSGHALLIGAGGDLPATVADAQGLAAILTDPTRCGYPPAQVHLCTEAAADRAGVLSALDQLAKESTADATVVIYFSGHGYQVQSGLGSLHYLMPHGYQVNDLPGTAISGLEFTQKVMAIPAGKLLLVLDCCHAGGLVEGRGADLALAKAPLPPEATILLGQGGGRVMLASSRADELSFAGRPYSAFTLALLAALCGQGASRQDGYVRVADLALYVGAQVPQRTQNRQHPLLHFEQADNFMVAYYAGGGAQPKALPSAMEQAQIEAQPGEFAAQSGGSPGGHQISAQIGAIGSNSQVAIGVGNVQIQGPPGKTP